MSLYALVQSGEVQRTKEFDGSPPDVSHKGFQWLPVVDGAQPAYDPMTHDLSVSWQVGESEATRVWSAVEASAEEQRRRTFDAQMEAGYHVEPEDFYLALYERDRADFTALLTLTSMLEASGAIDDSTPQKITDKDGGRHTVTLARLRQILAAYGVYYKTIWDTYKNGA